MEESDFSREKFRYKVGRESGLTDSTCLFCRIVSGEIPSEKVYEDGEVVAFKDIRPAAPVHILVIPKVHIASLASLEPAHAELAGRLVVAAANIAASQGLAERGYRLVANCGNDGGQTVGHLHFHLLGGRQLTWPPG